MKKSQHFQFPVINPSISISNHEMCKILNTGDLQKIKGELNLSISIISIDHKKRREELIYTIATLNPELRNFKASRIFLHYNVSFPGTENDAEELFITNFKEEYSFLRSLRLPIFLKVEKGFPLNVLLRLQESKMINGFHVIGYEPF